MTTRDTAAEPRTAAGRALLEAFFTDGAMPDDPGAAILAIEAEAAAPALTAAALAEAIGSAEWHPDEEGRITFGGLTINAAAKAILARLTPAAAELADEALRLLRAVLDTDYTISVSGHDVECDVVQKIDATCTCGFNEARRQAWDYLAAHPAPEEPRGE